MMSLAPDSPWRGAASSFSQPMSSDDKLAAQLLVELAYYYNCKHPPTGVPGLPKIEYRSSEREIDVRYHVFRWDDAPYEHVFEHGLRSRRQDGVDDSTYYNLELYDTLGDRSLDSRQETTHAFVSTTLNSGWYPLLTGGTEERVIYRYEIFAPGGILVPQTLGDRYQHPAQDEVCFLSGIAPQYIRSTQRFRLTRASSSTRRERVDTVLIYNDYFQPQAQPERPLQIQTPVVDFIDAEGRRQKLQVEHYLPSDVYNYLKKREDLTSLLITPQELIDYYTSGVADEDSYIDSAFRSATQNEAYLFMKNEYVLVNYAPGTAADYVVKGPLFIRDGFQSLAGTAFAEHGVDCAFGCPGTTEAFIFCGKLCAKISYGPSDRIVEGPVTIAQMFPFFKNTGFEGGCDAAFESTVENEAYIFTGKFYARVNYVDRRLITIQLIAKGFPSLANTIFASDIGTAFASHWHNQAYLFKDEYYIRFYFTPDEKGDYIINNRIEEIRPKWPSLRNILPRKNRGLDIHDQPN